MSRQVGPPRARAFVLLIFAALFACKVSSKYIKPKPSEFEISLPLACPDTCGIWCANCPVLRDRTEDVDTDDDGNIILNPLPDGTNTAEPNSESTSKPQTGGTLELGDEDVLIPSIPPTLRFRSSHLDSSSLSTRQNNEDIIKDGVTSPETWGAGPADWREQMNGIIDRRGLKLDSTPRSSAQVDYFDLSETGWAVKDNRAGGVPSLRGSILFVAASDLGIAMAHFWESPNFIAIRNVTDIMNPRLMWDIDIQDNSYNEHVVNFTQFGTLDWHDATLISEKYVKVPNSPAFTDLVRPGMILDQKSTQWREFRLFLPRHPHRRPPGTVPKYKDEFDNLEYDIATLLNIKSSEIIRHAPFYEGSGPVDSDGPHKPTDWHNTFTYQYGSPEKKDADADRELRVTWNGEVVAEMSRTWKTSRQNSGKCYLHVSVLADPTLDPDEENLDLRIRVIKEGERQVLFAEQQSYKAPYTGFFPIGQGRKVVEIRPEQTGLSEQVNFWLTPAPKRINATLGEQPRYHDWHINFKYGEDPEDEFKYMDWQTERTNVMCRGGSWHKYGLDPVLRREGLCTFQCD